MRPILVRVLLQLVLLAKAVSMQLIQTRLMSGKGSRSGSTHFIMLKY